MPPFEPIILTNGIIQYCGFRRPAGDYVWFSTGEVAMRYLAEGLIDIIWRIPCDEDGWRIIPLTRIES